MLACILTGCSDGGSQGGRGTDPNLVAPRDARFDGAANNSDGGDASSPLEPASGSKLCDGSQTPRLMYRLNPSPGRWPPGAQVIVENGLQLVAIDGTCTFHVKDGEWSPIRSGKLEERELQALVDALDVKHWPADGVACGDGEDAPWLDYWVLGHELRGRPCSGSDRRWVADAAESMTKQLFARGEEHAGPMRFSLNRRANPALDLDVGESWPFGDPDDYIAPPFDEDLGYVTRVFDAGVEEAAQLRGLRIRAAERGGLRWPQFISIIQADGAFYELYVRDLGPFEADDGAVVNFTAPDLVRK